MDNAQNVYCFMIFLNVYACDFYIGFFQSTYCKFRFLSTFLIFTLVRTDFQPAKFNIYLKRPLPYGVMTTIPRT